MYLVRHAIWRRWMLGIGDHIIFPCMIAVAFGVFAVFVSSSVIVMLTNTYVSVSRRFFDQAPLLYTHKEERRTKSCVLVT